MQNAQIYAQLLDHMYTTNPKGVDSFMGSFVAYLNAKKLQKMLPAILKQFEFIQDQKKTGKATTLIIRDDAELAKVTKELDEYKQAFNLEDLQVVTEKNIVGGFILKNKTNMIDASYRKALLALYTKLTA